MSTTDGADQSVELNFPSTCWGQLSPGSTCTARDRQAALDTLARRYMRPIRAFLERGLSRSAEEADDLAQDFFGWMMETGFVSKADPTRGRFRAFLKTALRHYVADHDRRARTLKRGGAHTTVPFHGDDESAGAGIAASTNATAEDILDDAWKADMIQLAVERVRVEFEEAGRPVVFAVFRDYFLDRGDETDYAEVARRHGISTVDVSNFLTRAKTRYRDHLRALVSDTVESPEDLKRELAWLIGASAS